MAHGAEPAAASCALNNRKLLGTIMRVCAVPSDKVRRAQLLCVLTYKKKKENGFRTRVDVHGCFCAAVSANRVYDVHMSAVCRA